MWRILLIYTTGNETVSVIHVTTGDINYTNSVNVPDSVCKGPNMASLMVFSDTKEKVRVRTICLIVNLNAANDAKEGVKQAETEVNTVLKVFNEASD